MMTNFLQKAIILFVMLMNYFILTAQYLTLNWAKAMGGVGYNWTIGNSITTDAAGNIYTTGYFHGKVDFDPSEVTYNLTSAVESEDIFIQKLDAFGNFVWVKRMGGTSKDGGFSLSLDTDGNVYTTGYFKGTVDFDPSAGTCELISAGLSDIFITKLDASGNFVWARSMGGTFDDLGNSLSIDTDGNVYTTGSFNGTVDFDPSAGTCELISAGLSDIFITKLDASGNFVWARSMGGILDDLGNSLSIDTDGNVYTTGKFKGIVDFDPGADTYNLSSAGVADPFIQKLDADGNLVWAKRMGGTNNSGGVGNSISIDAAGNNYTTGYFYGTVDFDPSAGTCELISAGYEDMFITKLDASGNFVWAKAIGGDDTQKGNSISSDAAGNIYIIGNFDGVADFDPSSAIYNLLPEYFFDIFITKLDTLGNLVWAKAIKGSPSEFGKSITTDADGNVYITGAFEGQVDFDPSAGQYLLYLNNVKSYYVAKYTESESLAGYVELTASGISIYPNPTSDSITISSEQVTINTIQVFDFTGKQNQQFSNVSNNNLTIDLSNFATGVYLIKLQTENEVFTTKIVKE